MGSLLPSSSSALTRQSTMRYLRPRFNSTASVSSLLRSYLQPFPASQSQIRSHPPHQLLSPSISQYRHIVTRITRPFAKSKSVSVQSSQSATRPTTTPSSTLPLTNLPYFIRRTTSNQLPVYLVTKAGGTKQQTRVRKTEGDLNALRADLMKYLGLEEKPSDIAVNQINGHITVKGWRKPEVQQFLLDRQF